MAKVFFVAAVCCLLTAQITSADVVYVTFSGHHGSGNIGGSPFDDVNWDLEFAIETSTRDSNLDGQWGYFRNSIVGANIRIDRQWHELEVSAFPSAVSLRDTGPSEYFSISMGGVVSITTGDQELLPRVFTNPNSLESLVIGSNADNTVPNAFGEPSRLRFIVEEINNQDIGPKQIGNDFRLVTTSGERIAISEVSLPGTGEMAVGVAPTSAVEVPEPATLIPLSLLLLAGFSFRSVRRKVRKSMGRYLPKKRRAYRS